MENEKQGLGFLLKYAEWAPENLKRAVWSDETKTIRFGSDGTPVDLERPKTQILDNHVQCTFKHRGGRLMLCRFITSLRNGQTCKVERIMSSRIFW